MWNKVIDFYKSNKCAILWTIGYVFATWTIMNYMFNFNIFSSTRWHQLMHAHLHGFAGMVFGILILAAVPMYIATTIVIARTKAPLFSFKVPECVKTFFINAFTQTPMNEEPQQNEPMTEPAPAPEQDEPAITENSEKDIPETVPSELRIAYMRARDHISRHQTSAFDLGHMTKGTTPTTPTQNSEPVVQPSETDIPIPTDFDIDDVDDMIDSIPTFTDINFDDDSDDETTIEINDVATASETTTTITEFLKSESIPYTVDNDVVITDRFAIVAHTDEDFWVADNESWFAAGKTRKSPIVAVKDAAINNNVEPILYLGADNIMDIDEMKKQWSDEGIRIVTDLKELK